MQGSPTGTQRPFFTYSFSEKDFFGVRWLDTALKFGGLTPKPFYVYQITQRQAAALQTIYLKSYRNQHGKEFETSKLLPGNTLK